MGAWERSGVGAQTIECTIESTEPFKIKFEKPLAMYKSEVILFRSDIKEELRIVGKGKVTV